MTRRGSGTRGALIVAAAIAGVAALWLALGRGPSDPDPRAEPPPPPASAPSASAPEPSATSGRSATSTTAEGGSIVDRIPEHGRLTLDAASLSALDVAVLELALPPEAQGSEPLSAVVVSVDGRRMETEVTPGPGASGAVRLELDPDWLRPGRYMIHVTTAEKTPLHFRRYVLDVQ